MAFEGALIADRELTSWMEEIYKDIHSHPELAMNEHRTTARIREYLTGLGIEQPALPDLDVGAVGLLRGEEGPVLAIRADIDALPIQEAVDVPYRSTIPGVMHACGHDLNLTILLGTIRHLVESGFAKRMKGTLKFIFQPAEEGLKGAKAMIESGVLENPAVDMILMSHGDPALKVGEIALFEGFSHANSDHFSIELHGRGGHGSRPHQTQDLILAGAYLINILQSVVSRDIDAREAAVLSVCSFNAGTASNVFPSSAVMTGTVRTLEQDVQETVAKRMQEACDAIAGLFHMRAELHYRKGVPSCPIDPDAEGLLRAAALDVIPEDAVKHSQTRMGGEDFAYFAQLVPAGVMRLGIAPPEGGEAGSTHSPTFRVDLRTLPYGVSIFTRAIERFFSKNEA